MQPVSAGKGGLDIIHSSQMSSLRSRSRPRMVSPSCRKGSPKAPHHHPSSISRPLITCARGGGCQTPGERQEDPISVGPPSCLPARLPGVACFSAFLPSYLTASVCLPACLFCLPGPTACTHPTAGGKNVCVGGGHWSPQKEGGMEKGPKRQIKIVH